MITLVIAGAAALLTVEEACSDVINKEGQQPGNACSALHAKKVEAELNKVWAQAVPVFRQRDRNWERLHDNPGYFQLILDEQRAWIRYREARCGLERHEMNGGSAATYTYNYCMVDMALDRIKYLTRIADLETK